MARVGVCAGDVGWKGLHAAVVGGRRAASSWEGRGLHEAWVWQCVGGKGLLAARGGQVWGLCGLLLLQAVTAEAV